LNYGTIRVLTFQEGADVIVDGILRRKTPIAKDKSNEPTLLPSSVGYRIRNIDLQIEHGQTSYN
jgi:hypothetical protein